MTLDLSVASDGELVRLALAGRQTAYGEIVRRHRDPLFRLLQSHVGDFHEAGDLLQGCFIAAFLSLDRYDSSRPMRAWLIRIAINKARDWRRRRLVRKFFGIASPVTLDMTDIIADDAPRADAVVVGRDELSRVTAAIASLPASLKEPLILSAVEGQSQAATAVILGLTEKAVETRIRRARSRLKTILTETD